MGDSHELVAASVASTQIKAVTDTSTPADASDSEKLTETFTTAPLNVLEPAIPSPAAAHAENAIQPLDDASKKIAFSLQYNEYAALTKDDLRNGPGPESLPSELQNASRDQTVCDYCGVSYLIFSEVQSLQRQLASSRAELDAWRIKIAQHDTLQQQLDTVRRDAEAARQRAAELEAQIFEKDAETSRLIREAEERVQALGDSRGSEAAMHLDQSRRLRAEARVSHLELQLQQSQASSSRIRQQMNAAQQSFAAHAGMLQQELNAAAAEQASVINQCSQSLHELTRRMAHMLVDKEALTLQLAQRESMHMEQERKMLELESNYERDQSSAAQQLQAAVSQLQQHASTLSAMGAQLMAKDTKLIELEHETQALKTQSSQLSSELQTTKESNVTLSQRVQELQQEISDAATAHESVSSATSMKFAEFQELLTRYDEAVKRAERQNLADSDRIRTLENTLADRDSHTALLRSQASAFKDHSAKQQQALIEEAQRRQTAEAAYSQLQTEYLELMRDKDDVVVQSSTIAKQNEQLLGAEQRAQAELESCKQQLLVTGEQRDNAVFDLTALRGEHNALLLSKSLLDKELEMLLEQQARASLPHATPEVAQEISRLQQEGAAHRLHQQELEQKIDQMEAVIHQECAERTFLTDEVNKLRKKAALPVLTSEEVTSSTKAYFDNLGASGSVSGAGAPADDAPAPARVHLPKLPGRNTPTPLAEPESAAYRAAQNRASSQAAGSSGRPIQGMSAKYATRR